MFDFIWSPIISDTSVIVTNAVSSLLFTIVLSWEISILVSTQYSMSFFPLTRPFPSIRVAVLPSLLYISFAICDPCSVIIIAAFACSNPSLTKSIILNVMKYIKSEYNALSSPNRAPAVR